MLLYRAIGFFSRFHSMASMASMSSMSSMALQSLHSRTFSSIPFQTSIATISLSKNSIYNRINELKNAGFDSFELMENDLPEMMQNITQFRDTITSMGVKISIFQPIRDFDGSWDGFDTRLAFFNKRLEIMKYLGVDLVLICSNCSNDEFDKERTIKQLRIASELAEKSNIKIAYEALSWSSSVSTLEQNWEIVQRVDKPNFGICIDSFHIFIHNSNIQLISTMKEKIFFVQLSDSEMGLNLPSYLLQSRSYRVLPGQGDFDNLGLLKQLKIAGYNGPVSLECFNESYRNAGLLKVSAQESLISLRYLGLDQLEGGVIYGFQCSRIQGRVVTLDYKDPFNPPEQSINLLVDDVELFNKRSKMYGYSNNLTFKGITHFNPKFYPIIHDLVINCERLTFNSLVLYIKSVLGLKELVQEREFTNYGLSIKKIFSNGIIKIELRSHGDEEPVLRYNL